MSSTTRVVWTDEAQRAKPKQSKPTCPCQRDCGARVSTKRKVKGVGR